MVLEKAGCRDNIKYHSLSGKITHYRINYMTRSKAEKIANSINVKITIKT